MKKSTYQSRLLDYTLIDQINYPSVYPNEFIIAPAIGCKFLFIPVGDCEYINYSYFLFNEFGKNLKYNDNLQTRVEARKFQAWLDEVVNKHRNL